MAYTVSIANLAKIQSWFWLQTPNVFLHAEVTPGNMGSYIVKEGGGGGWGGGGSILTNCRVHRLSRFCPP